MSRCLLTESEFNLWAAVQVAESVYILDSVHCLLTEYILAKYEYILFEYEYILAESEQI